MIKNQVKQGKRPDLGNVSFRSSWEANYARYMNHIGVKWQHEPHTFYFEKIKRGTRSYLPDFFLPEENRYVEVKGWWTPRARTQLRRMKKYHPLIQVDVVDAKAYREIEAKYGKLIPNWEFPAAKPLVERKPKASSRKKGSASRVGSLGDERAA